MHSSILNTSIKTLLAIFISIAFVVVVYNVALYGYTPENDEHLKLILEPEPILLASAPIQETEGQFDCLIRKQPTPKPGSMYPHVHDVFAADNFSQVYFITEKYVGNCVPEKENEMNPGLVNQVFLCEFTDLRESDRVRQFTVSKRTYPWEPFNSTVIISCPIPSDLRSVAENTENRAQLSVTLIPTRTQKNTESFEPIVSNFPVCSNPVVNSGEIFNSRAHQKHYLSACVFATGDSYAQLPHGKNMTDVLLRVKEWIEFHLMVGFEHFYFYDNSYENHSELWRLLEPYMQNKSVTYIHWPSRNCRHKHWSSQFAAENSCLRRFAQFNVWMAHFDVDEYMTPLGDFEDIPSILRKYENDDSVDAVGFNDHVYGYCKGEDWSSHNSSQSILNQRSCFSGHRVDYNRKEIIKPYKVLYHHVHYSVASWNGGPPKAVLLNDQAEGKLTHTRWREETNSTRDPEDAVVYKWIPRLEELLRNSKLLS
jgi:hypothetical protein